MQSASALDWTVGKNLRPRRGKKRVRPSVSGIVIGILTGFNEAGEALVDFSGSDSGCTARSLVVLEENAIGREVALLFDSGDIRKPIIVGMPQAPRTSKASKQKLVTAELDGERVILTAEKEIVLRCGQASLTLTKAGKVLIRGAYLLSRSSGVNRIKGGSVQIN